MAAPVGLVGRGDRRAAYPALLLLGAVDAAGYSVIAPVLPSISASTGAGPSLIGALVACFPLGMLAGFWIAGELLKRRSCETVIATGLGLLALGCVGFVVGEGLHIYFPARAVMGLGSGALWMGVTFGTLERWPGQEYLCMSRIFAAYSVGGLIGPALGAVGGIKGPFAAFLALVCLSAVAVALMGRPEQRRVFGSDRSALRSPGFWLASAAVLFAVMALGMIEGVLPLHFADSLDQVGIAALFVGSSLLVGIAAAAAGSFAPRRMVLNSLWLVVAGIGLAGVTDELALWLPAMALAAVGLGLGETGALGVLLAAVAPERIVTAMIVWSQMSIVGYLVGPLAGGAIAEHVGYAAIGLLPLVAAVIVASLLRLAPAGRQT
jgi:MFS family permease